MKESNDSMVIRQSERGERVILNGEENDNNNHVIIGIEKLLLNRNYHNVIFRKLVNEMEFKLLFNSLVVIFFSQSAPSLIPISISMKLNWIS